jgi:ERI1 exoribonuclease 2
LLPLQEIIEVSCVLVDTASLQLRPATFQRYVRPDQHPRLSAFCTELTGISQAM